MIATPLPLMARTIREAGGGLVAEFFSGSDLVDQVQSMVNGLANDLELRDSIGRNGWKKAKSEADWNIDGESFARTLERLASISDGKFPRIRR